MDLGLLNLEEETRQGWKKKLQLKLALVKDAPFTIKVDAKMFQLLDQ